ncbi:hypothetical protein GOBAR_AA37130 [Gossypium barbadense]|uniref:Uncharacterized protein n=1 Tax=Gossypium barbadense TaxID=3634 RepID=A0A2P5VXL0_GOSBA|nr:hypothetical protein GOBAR_AA37130 [Gossypium barbadense]
MVPRLDIARDNPWDFLKSSFDWHTVRYCEAFKEFLTSVWHTARDVVQILRSKYKMDGLVPNKLKDKNLSRHWKGIGNVREDVKLHKRPSKEWLKVNSGGAREIDTRIATDEWIRCYGRKIGNAWCLMRNSGEPWMASTMLGPLAQRR